MHSLFHPELHPLFEVLGYVGGYAFYRRSRSRQQDFLTTEQRWILLAAAAVGALAGSRVLGLLEQAPRTGLSWHSLFLPGGKTIVGGLLGGWLAVEMIKSASGIGERTGDLFAVPLCIGIAIGRIGCFFAGLADDTYGKATSLPWGVDFGDGVRRHPAQLYEVLFLTALAGILWRYGRRPHTNGRIFRLFLAGYLAWRLGIDFLKPQPLIGGMNVIQWACVAGLAALGIMEGNDRRQIEAV
ncbi:prolipoprotein diacylglyceryl transferase [Paracidobacterium acidisoli]|uniref:Diacylglyceryl transferase n=1 Tax=Paracidobacterium acidisoli TaxID=2303751 RepID=A0A372IRH5_9BACT|nr:prolipoprotein diacylglyceryl transferase family protein [Paracidobacterium acidisoli]MBT9330369.1 prolipoprotein diacylglyceryl transferase [Paracidobacterium acidisoli]